MIAPLPAGLPSRPLDAPLFFAPPLGARIVYRMVRTDPTSSGDCRIESVESLRFTARDDGYEVTALAETMAIEAPARTRVALQALFKPLIGVETHVLLDPSGRPGALIGEAAAVRALAASTAAFVAAVDADPETSPETKAMARSVVSRDATPERVGERLRQSVAGLLPPPLPPLVPGGSTTFQTTVQTPAGPLVATGTVTREADESGGISLRIEVATAPAASAAAAEGLRAKAAMLPDAARGGLLAAADAMAGNRFVERTTIAIDRKTGLLSSLDSVRASIDGSGIERPIGRRTIAKIDTVF